MTQAVERVSRMIEAFNASGLDAALAYVHPQVVWNAPPEWLEERVYRGRAGVRELAESWGEGFDEYRLDLERVLELERDRVLMLLVQRGRIKGQGNPMEFPVAWIVELTDGLLARADVYFGWEFGLEAAGIEE